ncbi:MAG: DUF2169 domain-containing protein [Burkholderiaceae bacterium]|nr:DUF2169 domain-containing protein [Burkholderiaceae bacterium]
MELAVGSKYAVADITVAVDKTGREHLLVVIKQTWLIGANGKPPTPTKAVPLEYADLHVGEPGLSPPLYECDFVLKKIRCDVLFNASAYAPDDQPLTYLAAGYRIDAHQKAVRIVGPRFWKKALIGIEASEPKPFTAMPLHYGLAFGGVRPNKKGTSGDQTLFDTYEANPVGTGYAATQSDPELVGMPLPCLEPFDSDIAPLDSPTADYPAVALSAVARHWLPRRQYGGTYDAKWKRDVFPFLPEDFDERFNQSAPEDQQIPFPRGGEQVTLMNLMRGRREVSFKLPKLTNMPVRVLMRNYTVQQPQVVVDTLYFEPDEERFSVVWRASVPIKRGFKDLQTIAVGGICKNWWEAKIRGAEGCANCAKKRATDGPAPAEEECEEAPITGASA